MKFKYPTTKFNDVWNYYNSISSEVNVCYARISAGFEKEKMFNLLKIRTAQVKEKYSKYLDWKDLYFFKNSEGLEKFLVQTEMFETEKINSSIQHEKEHAIKIKRLGFQVFGFDCWLVLDDQKIEYIRSCKMIVNKLPSQKDYIEIALAPKNPSYFDNQTNLFNLQPTDN